MRNRDFGGLGYVLAVLGALAGGIYGSIASWNFTFNTIVPWLEISHEWQKLAGLLIWFFGVWEIGAGLFAIIGLVAGGAVGLVIALTIAFFADIQAKRARAAAQRQREEAAKNQGN